jgi:hypothetical protein
LGRYRQELEEAELELERLRTLKGAIAIETVKPLIDEWLNCFAIGSTLCELWDIQDEVSHILVAPSGNAFFIAMSNRS